MNKEKITDLLNKFLADYYALFAKTQGYHWNIVGAHFIDLHSLFQKQYELMFENIDELAERIRTIGTQAPKGIKELSGTSTINDGKLQVEWQQIVADLATDHRYLCKSMYKISTQAEEEGDIITADLMVKLLNEHEKQIWMLDSLTQEPQ